MADKKPEQWDNWNEDQRWGYLRGLAAGRAEVLGEAHPNLEEGSKILITDLEVLLQEAIDGEFGDFTNQKYATPKVALNQRLHELAQNVIDGKYD